ncbi:hypothetical protein J1605_017977 [Eschrichtius robustus]|uniref:BTB domain-containing protein n=1 Tax=Eschrichtius robustus TaxID=9764 RepID=A0AB34HZ14_ESCRO|nr:hypothetical protein J1605_017977 [Eschrichtius robustus]
MARCVESILEVRGKEEVAQRQEGWRGGEMSESRAKRVRIKEVDGWTLRMLIDYVYTAEIQVTEENVQVFKL